MNKENVYQKIVQVAESLIQTSGYNAFSYRDIANEVGIKTSSIHYYFPTKADLGVAVVKMHVESLSDKLKDITNNTRLDCKAKLGLFFDSVFALTYFSSEKMCLGGMLAADVLTLPEIIQFEVRNFFVKIHNWLNDLLNMGVASKEIKLNQDASKEASLMLIMLEGGLLLARLYRDDSRLLMVKEEVLSRLG